MEIGIYMTLLILMIIIITRILKFMIISPIYIYLLFYGICLSLTTLYYYFYEDKISIYNFDFINSTLFLDAIKFHLLAMVSFCFGVIIYYDSSKSSIKKLFNRGLGNSIEFSYSLPNSATILTHVFMGFIIFFCVFSYGKFLFFRDEYLIEGNTTFITLMKLLSFVNILILGVTYYKNKLLSVSYFLLIFLIATGTGSRLAVVYALVYVLLIFLMSKKLWFNKLALGINAVAIFVYLAFLMSVRPLANHGLQPYFSSLFNNTTDIITNLEFNIYYTFIFGVFVTSKTLVGNATDLNTIAISLNPLPGKWVGWYEIAPLLRANIYAPYSANGEVFSMGKIFTFIFFTLIGLTFTFMEQKVRQFFKTGSNVFAFIILILCVLFVIYSYEYNLRSTVRYLYYALFVLGVYYLFGRYNYKIGGIKVKKTNGKND